MSRIILIHGWNVSDGGAESVGPLVGPLESLGHDTVCAKYGKVFTPWSTSLVSRKFAKYLSTKILPGDLVIGHSNGARIAYELSYYAPLIRKMVWLNPALDSDVVPAKSVRECLVVHSKNDFVTRIARWLPGTIWGAMGTTGYKPRKDDPWGYDNRMINVSHTNRHSSYDINTSMWTTIIDRFDSGLDLRSFTN